MSLRRYSPVVLVLAIFAFAPWAASPVAALDPTKAITQYAMDIWQASEGLPQGSVLAIVQTRDGYLWLGTLEGLVRFDGVQFSVYDTRNSNIAHNQVQALVESREGGLWIGTADGLNRLTNGTIQSYPLPDSVTNHYMQALFEDGAGVLWIGTAGGGLVRFDGAEFTSYTTDAGLPDNNVLALAADDGGTLWIGTARGLSRLEEGVVVPSQLAGVAFVIALYADRGDLWIGTDGEGVARLRGDRLTFFTTEDGLTGNRIASILLDEVGTLWVGTTRGGLNRRSLHRHHDCRRTAERLRVRVARGSRRHPVGRHKRRRSRSAEGGVGARRFREFAPPLDSVGVVGPVLLHNAAMKSRVHPKFKTKYRVGNWPAYDDSLVRRGDVTLWLSDDALAAWRPTPSGRPGGPRKFSDPAIETALTLRLVFRLPLRQTEGFLRSIFTILQAALEVPDHTTLSRRSQQLNRASTTAPGPVLCILWSTVRACRRLARVNGLPPNMAVAGSAAGRSCISGSTAPG